MDQHEFENSWRQLRGQIRRNWGAINDFDLDGTDGKPDRVIELIERKYGYTRQQAEADFDLWLKQAAVPESRRPGRVTGGP